MKNVVRYLLGCLSLFCAVFVLGGCDYGSSKANAAQLWGTLGAGVFDTIKSPDSVESYKLVSALPTTGHQVYQPADKVKVLSDEDVKQIQSMLLSDSSYLFGVVKTCVFVPETAFRFKKGDKDVLLLVSMGCKQVKFDLGEQGIRLDIDPIADQLTQFLSHLSN